MFLKAVHLVALFLFMGPPLSYLLAWRRVYAGDEFMAGLCRRFFLLTIAGGVLYLVSGLGLTFYAYAGFEQDGAAEWFLLNLILVPLFILCFRAAASGRSGFTSLAGMAASGLAILTIYGATTNAAAAPGLLPLAAGVIHTGAAAAWGGGILSFLFVPWTTLENHLKSGGAGFWRVVYRFSNIAIILFGVVILTGVIQTTVHVHGEAAMDHTAYGQTLNLKNITAAVLLGMLILNLMWIGPALKRHSENPGGADFLAFFRRFRIMVSLEALVIAALLAVTANLTTFEPPATAPFLNPQSWTMRAGEFPVRVEMQPVAGSSSNARFEIFLPDSREFTGGAAVYFNLLMPGRGIGSHEVEAVQASPNSYLGEASFPVPGNWRFELFINRLNGEPLTGSHDLLVPAQPLVDHLRTYLSYSAITYQSANAITFLVGLLLIATYGWLTRQSRLGKVPRWVTLGGLGGVALGFYLALGVSLVKTYPSTFWKNPQPYTAGVIGQGQRAYLEECAECHGDAGKGDGPWAVRNRGGIPDLSSPHMDVHTDGEIYWWITYGIPTLDMPPLASELSVEERWAVVNFVRSLRHGIP